MTMIKAHAPPTTPPATGAATDGATSDGTTPITCDDCELGRGDCDNENVTTESDVPVVPVGVGGGPLDVERGSDCIVFVVAVSVSPCDCGIGVLPPLEPVVVALTLDGRGDGAATDVEGTGEVVMACVDVVNRVVILVLGVLVVVVVVVVMVAVVRVVLDDKLVTSAAEQRAAGRFEHKHRVTFVQSYDCM